MNSAKTQTCSAIEKAASDLNRISQEIWSNPELCFNEHVAHELLCGYLEARGFNVQRKYKLDTAFRAEYGDGTAGPRVAVICEYDALPGIGHACGHNLIAEAGIAAAIGIKNAMEESESSLGKLIVLGTPAEEGGGGKVDLIRAGCFADIDFAMMVHPSNCNSVQPMFIARESITATFTGKASHAAEAPWDGVNALDAAILCYQSWACLRQQMKPSWRLHAIITNGGCQPNVIPDTTELYVYIRAPSNSELEILKSKVLNCANGAATMTGCSVEVKLSGKAYMNLVTNQTLGRLYRENALLLGVDVDSNSPVAGSPAGSTDMGNVSYEVPSIHPTFFIGNQCTYHTHEFTAAAGSAVAQPYTLTQGKVMALTALDVFASPELVAQMKAELEEELKKQ